MDNAYKITDCDEIKAQAIVDRLNQKDKAGKDYVYTLGVEKDFSFIYDILEGCDDSTVLLVTSSDDVYHSVGIVFFGECGKPLIYGSIGDQKMKHPHFLEDVNDICGGQKWCIGEIRTANTENAIEVQGKSLVKCLYEAFPTFISHIPSRSY